jgi:hypothetical protein
MAVTKRTTKPKAEKTARAKLETKATAAPAETAAPAPAKVTTRAVDINEAVRARAYQLFEQRGYTHGADLEDWLRAEAEVLAQFGARTA